MFEIFFKSAVSLCSSADFIINIRFIEITDKNWEVSNSRGSF